MANSVFLSASPFTVDGSTILFPVGATLGSASRRLANVYSVLGNFSGDVTAANITSGVYTPTVTAVANLSGVAAYECQYLRVGNTVTVSGAFDANPVAGAAATELSITLPIASNFGAASDAGGTCALSTAVSAGGIYANAANDHVRASWISVSTADETYYFTFTYQII